MANAYLKNKELFIGMIFPFLSPGLLLLKFHFLDVARLFSGNETARTSSRYWTSLPKPLT